MNLSHYDLQALSLISYFDVINFQEGMLLSEMLHEILESPQNAEKIEDDIYYEMNFEALQELNKDAFHTFRVNQYINENNSNGVVFYIFENEECVVIVYRGSELNDFKNHTTGWQDWMDNFEMFEGYPTLQQLVALRYVNAIETTKDIILTGHSKGGNLVEFITICCSETLYKQIKEVVVFNAPGIQKPILDAYPRHKQEDFIEKFTIYENEHDVISSFFYQIKKPIIIKSSILKESLLSVIDHHFLHGISYEEEQYLLASNKSLLPRLFQHFINQIFPRISLQKRKLFLDDLKQILLDAEELDDIYGAIFERVKMRSKALHSIELNDIKEMNTDQIVSVFRNYYIIDRLPTLPSIELDTSGIEQSIKEMVETYDAWRQKMMEDIKKRIESQNEFIKERLKNRKMKRNRFHQEQ